MEHVSSVRPTGKFPEKLENLKRWSRFPGWNFRTECRVPFTFLVVCTSSRSTVKHRHVPGFTTKWNNFLPIGNSTFAPTEISVFFFVNGKRPWCQKTLQTHRKGRPSGKLTWYEPHSDHLEYLTRQHITKIHPPKHRTIWDSYHAAPRNKCDFRHALGALFYTSQFRKYQKT